MKTYSRQTTADVAPGTQTKISQLRPRQVTFNPTERHTNPPVRRRRIRIGKRGFSVLLGVVAFIGVPLFWSQAVVPTVNGIQDHWQYGAAPVTQIDANVGHHGTSHFLAEYHDGSITVFELSLSDPADTHVYTLSGMLGSTNTPIILLTITDMNHDGKPDLVIGIKGTDYEKTLYNNGSTFQEGQP